MRFRGELISGGVGHIGDTSVGRCYLRMILNGPELILRGSIWLALTAGMIAVCLRKPEAQGRAWLWGGAAYFIHVLAAFHFRHGWSHAAAWAATARQTAAVTGWDFGAGLWVNYCFTVAWALAAFLWVQLPNWCRKIWIAWFLFMTLNGAVVFVAGPARWLGVGLFVGLVLAVFAQNRRAKRLAYGVEWTR